MKIVAVLDGRSYTMTPQQFREYVRRGLINRGTTLFLNDLPISYDALIQALNSSRIPQAPPTPTAPNAASPSGYSAPKPAPQPSTQEPEPEPVALRERHATYEEHRKSQKRRQTIVMGILLSCLVCILGLTLLATVAHLLGFKITKENSDNRASASASEDPSATPRRRRSPRLDQYDDVPEAPDAEQAEPLFGDVFNDDDPHSRQPIPEAPKEAPKKPETTTTAKASEQKEQTPTASVIKPVDESKEVAVSDKERGFDKSDDADLPVAVRPSAPEDKLALNDPASGQFLLDPFDVHVKQLPPHFRGHDAGKIIDASKKRSLFAELPQKNTESDKAYEKRLNKLMRELSNTTIYGNITYGSILAFELKVVDVEYDPDKNMASTTVKAESNYIDKHGLVFFEAVQKVNFDVPGMELYLCPAMSERGRILHMDKVNLSTYETIESRVRAICIAKLYTYPQAPYIYCDRLPHQLYLTEPTFWLYDEQTGSILQRFSAQEVSGGFAKPIMPLRPAYEAIEPNGFHPKPRVKGTSHDADDLFGDILDDN